MAVRTAICILLASGALDIFARGAGAEERKACPVTLVNRGIDNCDVQGLVGDPVIISSSVQSTREQCGAACLSNADCLSLNYERSKSACTLYGKALKDMYTSYYQYQPGYLYERYCFTQNCHIIRSCRATNECDFEEIGGYPSSFYDYARFACSYGMTAKADPGFKQILLDGSISACDAVRNCTREYDNFDLHYYQPSKQWVCRENNRGVTDPTSYTVRNRSVGAGYGYYLYDYGYYD